MIDIRSLNQPDLKNFFISNQLPVYRADQVLDWIWKKGITDFNKMSNLSIELRQLLLTNYSIASLTLKEKRNSEDKTIKYVFSVGESNIIESVLIPDKERVTACISTQTGCALGCTFCATGLITKAKNLSAGEIYDQVFFLKKESQKEIGKPLTNIVFMGMGEPLLNYKELMKAIDYINGSKGLVMSNRRITISTAGITKMIMKLADDHFKGNLAVSLHSANDKKRSSIMPINQSNSLKYLKDSLKYYSQKSNDIITIEYIMFNDFNDSLSDAKELLQFCSDFKSKINIIEYNQVEQIKKFKKSTQEKIDKFTTFLREKGMEIFIRKSRGGDIGAACGQLFGKLKQEK